MFVKTVSTIARFSLLVLPIAVMSTANCGGSDGGTAGSTGTAGSSGTTGAAGTMGAAGTTGSAGTTGTAGTSAAKNCTVVSPTAADMTILDFDAVAAGAAQATFGGYMMGLEYGGGTYIYPNAAMAADQMGLANSFDGMTWHITGLVKDYSGFGLYLTSKTDASMFGGLQFDIKGTFTPAGDAAAAPTAQATMTIVDSAHEVDSAHTSDARMTCGSCMPANGSEYDGTCAQPSKVIPLTGASVTQTIHWNDLTGGKRPPSFTGESPNPMLLTALAAWALPWNGTGSATYMVDITVDNIKFITP
jgi:hypothetical protein